VNYVFKEKKRYWYLHLDPFSSSSTDANLNSEKKKKIRILDKTTRKKMCFYQGCKSGSALYPDLESGSSGKKMKEKNALFSNFL
jgi:hypothetical protein